MFDMYSPMGDICLKHNHARGERFPISQAA
jgi:hypothetical protein